MILSLLLIQLYRPKKNAQEMVTSDNITDVVEVSKDVQTILERSCYDCHSNNTNYLWYHNIAPVSWIVGRHIKEGKEHLNFDTWSTYNANQKEHIIDDLKETIETREMPLVGYIKLHPEATLSVSDNQLLLDWIDSLENE